MDYVCVYVCCSFRFSDVVFLYCVCVCVCVCGCVCVCVWVCVFPLSSVMVDYLSCNSNELASAKVYQYFYLMNPGWVSDAFRQAATT